MLINKQRTLKNQHPINYIIAFVFNIKYYICSGKCYYAITLLLTT